MEIKVTSRRGCLRISVAQREGTKEAKDALQRIIEAIETSGQRRLLISVRESQAIFNVAEYGLLDGITRLAGIPGLRIALVADSDELLLSYRYVEALAQERNLVARAFRSEKDAEVWLQVC